MRSLWKARVVRARNAVGISPEKVRGNGQSKGVPSERHRRSLGFSLIEMLLSIAILTILVGVSLPIFGNFQARNDVDLTAQSVMSMVRRAQVYSRSVNRDVAWSVEFQANTITLFAGTNFASRNTAYDETIAVPASVTVTGIGEVQFIKMTGLPNIINPVNVILTSNATSVRTISINVKGVVDVVES
jgi:prepilin-type N-terminal cleavage/methylation domain-containing protein